MFFRTCSVTTHSRSSAEHGKAEVSADGAPGHTCAAALATSARHPWASLRGHSQGSAHAQRSQVPEACIKAEGVAPEDEGGVSARLRGQAGSQLGAAREGTFTSGTGAALPCSSARASLSAS